ncbi:MAG: phasin family protein [Pseudomonadota bacterium]
MMDKFPFFDFNAMTDAMKVPGFDKLPGFDKMPEFPTFDMGVFQEAQKKNMAAFVEANKTAYSGYAAIAKRQTEMFEAAIAETKDRINALQGQGMTVESAQANYETLKTAMEKAMSDVKEVAEMANSTNTDAFEILKSRAEEAFAEMQEATGKLAN